MRLVSLKLLDQRCRHAVNLTGHRSAFLNIRQTEIAELNREKQLTLHFRHRTSRNVKKVWVGFSSARVSLGYIRGHGNGRASNLCSQSKVLLRRKSLRQPIYFLSHCHRLFPNDQIREIPDFLAHPFLSFLLAALSCPATKLSPRVPRPSSLVPRPFSSHIGTHH